MNGGSGLEEMMHKNDGKSVFHFLRVKGVEQLKAVLRSPHARDVSADGVFAAAEVTAAAGESDFAKEALDAARDDPELLGQTIARLFATNSRGAANVPELLEEKTCDAVLAAAVDRSKNNLLHIALKNCASQATIDGLVDRLERLKALGALIGEQNADGDLPIFVGLAAGRKCDLRLVPERCAARNAKGQNILHFVCGVAGNGPTMGGGLFQCGGAMQLGARMGAQGPSETCGQILARLEGKRLDMKALFEQLDKDGASPLNRPAMDVEVLKFALAHGVDLAACSAKRQILTVGMGDVVYPCLKARVHLVYNVLPGQSFGSCSGLNIDSLNHVFQYAAGQNDHEVLKLVPACDDNQLLADALYLISPMHSEFTLELARLLEFTPSKYTAYFGLNLLSAQGAGVDQDFIRDKLMPRGSLEDIEGVRLENPPQVCGVMHFLVKCKLPWPKKECQRFTLYVNPIVQGTLLQTWESLVSADNCVEFVSALV